MMKINVAIIGCGNIGKAAAEAVLAAPDMNYAGSYHHNDNLEQIKADVALLCVPTRQVPEFAEKMLKLGISTVDSFDIHKQIYDLRQKLMPIACEQKAVSVISAGWDPGSDSVIRTILQAVAPKGITYTNFGPGRSMGHSVAVKSMPGVRDALSMTIPLGTGIHRRMVYVELEEGADFAAIEKAVKSDDYFVNDETHVIQVPSVDALNNVAHGVNLVRSGVSGNTHNQRFEFNMEINNPALTGQMMVACARAAYRLCQNARFGAYTLIDIPPIALLSGTEEEAIRSLV
ncbi:MAG: diaminopimelate dehydrogenase [Bacteroidales bacterium]|nr:diaminopimelate dehydrogenase [Bacteroidales bacterium]